jgi:hypothetical protein
MGKFSQKVIENIIIYIFKHCALFHSLLLAARSTDGHGNFEVVQQFVFRWRTASRYGERLEGTDIAPNAARSCK